jgi:hypothetical protein
MSVTDSIEHLLEANARQSNASVNIIDESVLTGESKTYKILCTINTSFIALALFDARKTKFFGLETFNSSKPLTVPELSEKINSLNSASTLLKRIPYHKISVQLSDSSYTFVPSPLFHPSDAGQYFYLNHPKKLNKKIESETVKAYDLVNVFSVEEQVIQNLKNVFKDFTLHHHMTALLQSVKMLSGKDNERQAYVHFRNSWVDILVTEDKKLILANSFNYKSIEDAVYYILSVFEQLGLNPHSIGLTIMGEIEKESAISQLLCKYLANISYSSRLQAAQFSYGFDKLPSHFYHSVFSHALCE